MLVLVDPDEQLTCREVLDTGAIDHVRAAESEHLPRVATRIIKFMEKGGSGWADSGGDLVRSAVEAVADVVYLSDTAGRMWAANDLIRLNDLSTTDSRSFVRHDVVAETELRSAIGISIAADHDVVAILTIFLSAHRTIEDRFVTLVSMIAEELAEVMVRQRTTDQLRRERELQRRVFDMCPVGVIITDSDGHLIRANDRLEQILRLSRAELTEQPSFADVWDATDGRGNSIRNSDLPIENVLATGTPVEGVEHEVT